MKRALNVTTLLAMGLLVASSFAAAQEKVQPASTTGGEISMDLIGRSDVGSSKFEEYRVVPEGASLPFLSIFRTTDKVDFNVRAFSVGQDDQRYTGWANFTGVGIAFDYNQIPHNMGNRGRVIFNESSPGNWTMSQTERKGIHDIVDATPTAGRTYAFYQSLLAPTGVAANPLDISSLRQRGDVAVDLGPKLPFALTATYTHELKTGSRGASGGDILGGVTSTFDVPEPLNEIVQDFGLRAEYPLKGGKVGNLHASFNRNTYNNRAETLVVPNPFQAVDEPYNSSTAVGGPANVRMINSPDNEATTGRAGFMLKFKRQTRLSGDFSMASWTQNAAFYPYTINSAILTGSGQPANLTSSLQQQSLNGKINTTMFNFSFSSRPIRGLGLRARYRTYDLSNKTTRWVITGDTSGSPDRSWAAADAPTVDAPYGHVTANPYDTTTKTFTASASYDFKALTLEGAFRSADLSRTYREAVSGTDTGGGFSVLYRATDWLGFRGTIDRMHRSAEGETLYGFQADEAERDTTRAGADVQLSPGAGVGLNFSYRRRHHEFPNRPNRIAVSSGVPVAGAQPIPGTPSGLLDASFDSYTTEVSYARGRADLSAYYTYDKDATTNQWSTTSGVALNNLLNYAGKDQTDSYGANAVIRIVPDKWTFTVMANHQDTDGTMDITAREAGAFYTPGRTTLIPAGQGGAADIADWDDTTLTTTLLQLDYGLTRNWVLGVGYVYEKYSYGDAYTSGTALLPQSVLLFMKPDEGGYTMNIGFAKLTYRF